MTAAKSILLVEDEVLLCWVLEEALQADGHRVVTRTSGDAGLAAPEEGRFDLLVTNIRLKDGPDGWELARRARELHPDICVLYVSGDSVAQHPAQGVPESMMLAKPFEPERLRQTVRELVERCGD